MRRILLALALVALATTAANATTYVWWDLAPGNTSGITKVSGGTQGSTLVLEKPLTPPNGQYYEFTVQMWMASDGVSPNGTSAHKSNLFRRAAPQVGAPGIDTSMTMQGTPLDGVSNDVLNPLGWSGASGFVAGSQNSGAYLIRGWGKSRGAAGSYLSAGSSLQFIYMTIRITDTAEEFCDWHYVFQTVGSGAYGWAPPTPATLNKVVFGQNAFVYGNTEVQTPNYDTLLPVIAIHAIPEPATLALLGFGFLALLRRR